MTTRQCVICERLCPPRHKYCSDGCRRLVSLDRKRIDEARRKSLKAEEINALARLRYHVAKATDPDGITTARQANRAQQRERIAAMTDEEREAYRERRRAQGRASAMARRSRRAADPAAHERYLVDQAEYRRKRLLRAMLTEI